MVEKYNGRSLLHIGRP